MIVFLSGPISSDPDYRKKFLAAQDNLTRCGYAVLNPAMLPQGMQYEQYMRICEALMREADAIVLLPGWRKSKGACREAMAAYNSGMIAYEYTGDGVRSKGYPRIIDLRAAVSGR